MSNMKFEKLLPGDESKISEMSQMASEIVREHYDPILGKEQNDYMLVKFQSVEAIKNQLENGYRYYFAKVDGKNAGFMAFYPRGDAMYLSKLYLYKHERGKGYSKEMLAFLKRNAEAEGLFAVELNVNKRNEALEIYKKLGFEVIRAEKIDIGSGYYMDDYVCRLEF